MTDLVAILPHFALQDFSNLIPSLEKHNVSVTDILTCEAADVAKRAQVPAREVRRLTDAVLAALHQQLGVQHRSDAVQLQAPHAYSAPSQWSAVSVLDDALDAVLGGGFPIGYLSEVTGESGAGKTQLLLTLLLAAQLPPPSGSSRSAIYISTEAPLPTSRLSQLLTTHPRLATLSPAEKPSLSRILALQTPDLESQDHILRYQLPVAIVRHNVSLVVIDSITANYRAEFETTHTKDENGRTRQSRYAPVSMARRSAQLLELGALLRGLARTHHIAVVVVNQVSDRFTVDTSRNISASSTQPMLVNAGTKTTELPVQVDQIGAMSIPAASAPLTGKNAGMLEEASLAQDPLTLDYQQRFFTGWGASSARMESSFASAELKTPSLGLVWANQIACRVALVKIPARSRVTIEGDKKLWTRHLKVVFAPWARGEDGNLGTEFVIESSGLKSIGTVS